MTIRDTVRQYAINTKAEYRSVEWLLFLFGVAAIPLILAGAIIIALATVDLDNLWRIFVRII